MRWMRLGLGIGLVLACGAAQACVDEGGKDRGSSQPSVGEGTGVMTGQTGSPRETECVTDSECRSALDGEVAGLARPEQESRRFLGGTCEQVSVAGSGAGPACVCEVEGGGTINIGPAGGGCFVLGRAGDCLWGEDESPSCSLGARCDKVCQTLLSRLQADKAGAVVAEVLQSTCSAGNCQNVLRIGARCFANGSYRDGKGYDCALGPAKILEAHAAGR